MPMEAAALNQVDVTKIQETVKVDLCMAAIEAVQRLRDDPAYQERFRAWQERRKQTA